MSGVPSDSWQHAAIAEDLEGKAQSAATAFAIETLLQRAQVHATLAVAYAIQEGNALASNRRD